MGNGPYPTPPPIKEKPNRPHWTIIGTFWVGVVGVIVAIAVSPGFREWLQNLKNGGEGERVFATTNESAPNPQKADDNGTAEIEPQRGLPSAIFSNPTIDVSHMHIVPVADFFYNNQFPSMFGGTWRITAPGGGFTGTFSVPTDGWYYLVVTHGSSYNDLIHQPGHSPVTIQINSKTIVQDYDPTEHHPEIHGGMATDRWLIFARAGQNKLQWTYAAHGTTHYWIHDIVILPDQ